MNAGQEREAMLAMESTIVVRVGQGVVGEMLLGRDWMYSGV